MIAAVAAIWAVIYTRQAARAAAKAAEAAKDSAKAFIDSERAWVLVEHDANGQNTSNSIIFTAVNYGHSPAEILWFIGKSSELKPDKELPRIPNYSEPDLSFVHRHWVPQGKPMLEKVYVADLAYTQNLKVLEDIQLRRQKLWIYGIVRYKDTVSDSVHETRFCYSLANLSPPRLIMDGPNSDYNKLT